MKRPFASAAPLLLSATLLAACASPSPDLTACLSLSDMASEFTDLMEGVTPDDPTGSVVYLEEAQSIAAAMAATPSSAALAPLVAATSETLVSYAVTFIEVAQGDTAKIPEGQTERAKARIAIDKLVDYCDAL